MATIEEAKVFLQSRLFSPALSEKGLPAKLRSTLNTTWSRLQQFRRPGDLLTYLDRFEGTRAAQTGAALQALGLATFEDLRGEFRKFLGGSADDVTTLSDFVIGGKYTTWDILIFARVYDPRHGGIYLIPNDPPYEAIFVKATLEGGKYANKWIEPKTRLKYYFYAIKGKFDPKYKFNVAVRTAGKTPIFVFVRGADDSFTLEGAFRYVNDYKDSDGARWFELEKLDSASQPYFVTDSEYAAALEAKVSKARADNPAARKARLAAASKKPRKVTVVSTNFARNPDVIAEVLGRASGHCEQCKQPAPFVRKADGTPYLEVHHIERLADGGDDTVENALAMCPNCHRERHYGP